MTKKILAGIAVGILALGVTGCGSNAKRDLEGISSYDPEYAEIYTNVDEQPNIGLVCVRGVGFATTTRDFTSILRVKEWDAFCAQFKQHSIDGAQLRKNGGS